MGLLNCNFNLIALLFLLLISIVNANDDKGCCRKRINCYICDSRVDEKCAHVNKTTEGLTVQGCDDYCAKVQYKYGSTFYYIRMCADSFKDITIKKTNVCYPTRAKTGGYLCFCETDLCNHAKRTTNNFYNFSFIVSVIFFVLNF